jgi:ribonucleotide monophosphatase NagD (HAD superfamily)
MRAPKYAYALVDLSGTIHQGTTPLPGAVQAIKTLRQDGIVQVRFLTNTSMTSRRRLLLQLRSIGFDEQCVADESEILTAATAAASSIEERKLTPLLLTEDATLEDFERVLPNANLPVPTPAPNCVVVGLAPSKLDYETMNKAFRVLNVSSDTRLPDLLLLRSTNPNPPPVRPR